MLWFVLLSALCPLQAVGRQFDPSPVSDAAVSQETTRRFPAEVELVALELMVVDRQGRPVRDLRPDEFRLEVAGRPRRVVTAEFVAVTEEVAEGEQSPAAPGASYTTNETGRPGRLVLLIVDTLSTEKGKGREEIAAASAMLDRLGPSDRVGLLTIPSSGPQEEFTTDHGRVRKALTKVVGLLRPATTWCASSSPRAVRRGARS